MYLYGCGDPNCRICNPSREQGWGVGLLREINYKMEDKMELDFDRGSMEKAKWLIADEDGTYFFKSRDDAEEYAAENCDNCDDIFLIEIKKPLYVNRKRRIEFTEL